jgi:hypothetical protein
MRHELYLDLDLTGVPIKKKDVVFKVYSKETGSKQSRKFGELRLSQGAVVWRGRKDKQGRKISWSRFDALMQEEARLSERRPPGTRTGVARRKRERY